MCMEFLINKWYAHYRDDSGKPVFLGPYESQDEASLNAPGGRMCQVFTPKVQDELLPSVTSIQSYYGTKSSHYAENI